MGGQILPRINAVGQRDAFNHNWTVTLDYNLASGKTNGIIIRTALTK